MNAQIVFLETIKEEVDVQLAVLYIIPISNPIQDIVISKEKEILRDLIHEIEKKIEEIEVFSLKYL